MTDQRSLARAQRLADLSWLLAHPQGRRVLGRFFDEVNRRPFAGENTHATAYAEGRIDIAREVLQDARAASIDDYHRAEREHQE